NGSSTVWDVKQRQRQAVERGSVLICVDKMTSIDIVKPSEKIQTGTPAAVAPSQNPLSSQGDAGDAAQPGPELDPVVTVWIEKINQVDSGRVGWVIQIGECL